MNYSRILRSLSLPALLLCAVSCKTKGDPYANSNPYYGPQGAYGDYASSSVEPVSDSSGYVAPAPAEPTYSAPPSAPTRRSSGGGGSKSYTVVSGDNLYRIALRHNTSIKAVKNANGLTSDVIQPGQKLRIP